MVWYHHLLTGFSGGSEGGLVSYLLKNFPQFAVIHTVTQCTVTLVQSMKQKKMLLWNYLAFSMIQQMLAI